MQKFGSLNALALASVDELKQISGVGPDKAATLVAAFALARRMEQERREDSPVLDNPATVVSFMREENRLGNVESFLVLLLNTRKRLIRVEKISQGLLDTILVIRAKYFARPSWRMRRASSSSTIIRVATRRRARRTSR